METSPETGFGAVKAHPFEETIVAVLDSHPALEEVYFRGDKNMLGTAFLEACLRLPELRLLSREKVSWDAVSLS